MTQEEKELLLKDLGARLSYGVICKRGDYIEKLEGIHPDRVYSIYTTDEDELNVCHHIENIIPYLRPMSSMTEEEKNDYIIFRYTKHHEWDGHSTYTEYVEVDEINNYFDWLNAHHFDYRGLIDKGLALEAPEEMYKF